MTDTTEGSFAELAFGTQQECQQELDRQLAGSAAHASATRGVKFNDQELVVAVVGSMSGPIGAVFRGVWERYDKVQRACTATANQPTAERWVSFMKVPLSITKRFDVVMDAIDHVVMEFLLQVKMDLDGANVHVLGGRVAGFNPGRATTAGTFGYNWPGAGVPREIASWEPRPIALPLYIRLDGGS